MKKIFKIAIIVLGAAIGLALAQLLENFIVEYFGEEILKLQIWIKPVGYVFFMLMFSILGFIVSENVSNFLIDFVKSTEKGIIKESYRTVLFITIGVSCGIIVAFFFSQIVSKIDNAMVVLSIDVIVYIICIYLAVAVANKFSNAKKQINLYEDEFNENNSQLKYVDSSLLIDGRIYQLCKTGLVEGTMIIPEFVLKEVEQVASSKDQVKREKGKFALDLVNALQSIKDSTLEIKIGKVAKKADESTNDALIRIASSASAKLMTVDYNLQKVAQVQGVRVINISELVKSVRSNLIAGDKLSLIIQKAGKERKQGIGYLQDGTMVVVEDAKDRIGDELYVEITSSLQTSAGRMIFASITEE